MKRNALLRNVARKDGAEMPTPTREHVVIEELIEKYQLGPCSIDQRMMDWLRGGVSCR